MASTAAAEVYVRGGDGTASPAFDAMGRLFVASPGGGAVLTESEEKGDELVEVANTEGTVSAPARAVRAVRINAAVSAAALARSRAAQTACNVLTSP